MFSAADNIFGASISMRKYHVHFNYGMSNVEIHNLMIAHRSLVSGIRAHVGDNAPYQEKNKNFFEKWADGLGESKKERWDGFWGKLASASDEKNLPDFVYDASKSANAGLLLLAMLNPALAVTMFLGKEFTINAVNAATTLLAEGAKELATQMVMSAAQLACLAAGGTLNLMKDGVISAFDYIGKLMGLVNEKTEMIHREDGSLQIVFEKDSVVEIDGKEINPISMTIRPDGSIDMEMKIGDRHLNIKINEFAILIEETRELEADSQRKRSNAFKA